MPLLTKHVLEHQTLRVFGNTTGSGRAKSQNVEVLLQGLEARYANGAKHEQRKPCSCLVAGGRSARRGGTCLWLD